jgi:hypothetical protein
LEGDEGFDAFGAQLAQDRFDDNRTLHGDELGESGDMVDDAARSILGIAFL